MRLVLVAPLAVAFVLSACGSSDGGADADGDGEITAEEAVAEMADGGDITMRAGQWEQTVHFTEMDLPGVPENMRGMVMSQMGNNITTSSCRSEEQLNRPEPDFFESEGQNNCTFQEFDRSGNRMTVRMTCDAGQGGTVNVNMNGEFSADSYELNLDNRMTGMPMGDMTMKGTISGRRVGDC